MALGLNYNIHKYQPEQRESGELSGTKYTIWELMSGELHTTCKFYWEYGEQGSNEFECGLDSTLQEAYQVIKELGEVRVFTPRDIYNIPVWRVDKGGNIHAFLSSINEVGMTNRLSEQTRVCVKAHGTSSSVQSVWLDEQPFMVWIKEGRESENEAHYITDEDLYQEFLKYIQGFKECVGEVVNVDSKCLRKIGYYYVEELLHD